MSTSIPGLMLFELPVHGDNRGWFKENWQREKMAAAGLPDFGPVQNNISLNRAVGTTRGIHAEPWDKWVSVASGRIFGAWVDLRRGPTFGRVFTAEVDPSRAVFVPRGVGNAFQTLMPDTAYTYLVNDHWSPDGEYAFVNLADPQLSIPWPIPLDRAELSEKDRSHPPLIHASHVTPRKILVVGADGQVGRALRKLYEGMPEVEFAGRAEFDLTDPASTARRHWRDYGAVVNAAAYTAVDRAETDEGRRTAWAVNVAGTTVLSRLARENGLTLVHISSDYVFDGAKARPYTENDPVSPLGVYGQTKAAADAIVSTVDRHYVLRTSWVIGEGSNFVRTMQSLAARGVQPRVVSDQIGRLTFTDDLARAIAHLLDSQAKPGIYNVTGAGDAVSWADIARDVYAACGRSRKDVQDVDTLTYFRGASGPVAPRPPRSVLDLTKIESTGFTPRPWRDSLRDYLRD
ncbi:dTDP-4-dehydrorhamnose reductase [Microbacterium sp. ABRD28]|uniref:dTDP-4-dehydrorhamnose reductase n=1 Tax=Microbacterium sp. ABRD28 TaxID=2268461 RepID=UPI001F0C3473|nr:dTDP-4-dehydrorhamnose reductase [Microbacterium sp. ABRD28]